ncbi:MAG TPA: hypothetical protein VHI98_23260 [Vicinamibacterales bacterium]|jgi:hypothetical protein|nr:hypothetical protein [Vicinamibacterales bacterium]
MRNVSDPADFAPIEAAIHSVVASVGQLPVGDAENHVRRSLDELHSAFTTRSAIEPPVERLLGSVRMLHSASAQGAMRRFLCGSSSRARVLSVIQNELLPALRRVGFQV